MSKRGGLSEATLPSTTTKRINLGEEFRKKMDIKDTKVLKEFQEKIISVLEGPELIKTICFTTDSNNVVEMALLWLMAQEITKENGFDVHVDDEYETQSDNIGFDFYYSHWVIVIKVQKDISEEKFPYPFL